LFLTAGDQYQEAEQQWCEHSHVGTMFSDRVARQRAGALRDPAGQGVPSGCANIPLVNSLEQLVFTWHVSTGVMAEGQSLSALPLLSSPSSSWYLHSMLRNGWWQRVSRCPCCHCCHPPRAAGICTACFGTGGGRGSVVVHVAIVVIPLEQLVFAQHAPELVVAQGQQLGGFALIILGLLHRLLE
jgi:hypothetical protein